MSGIRQPGSVSDKKDFCTQTTAVVSLENPMQGARAGISAYYSDSYHYEIYLKKEGESIYVCLGKHVHDIIVETARAAIPSGKMFLFGLLPILPITGLLTV